MNSLVSMTLMIIAKPMAGSMPPATERPEVSHLGMASMTTWRAGIAKAAKKPSRKPPTANRITVMLQTKRYLPSLLAARARAAASWLPEQAV